MLYGHWKRAAITTSLFRYVLGIKTGLRYHQITERIRLLSKIIYPGIKGCFDLSENELEQQLNGIQKANRHGGLGAYSNRFFVAHKRVIFPLLWTWVFSSLWIKI